MVKFSIELSLEEQGDKDKFKQDFEQETSKLSITPITLQSRTIKKANFKELTQQLEERTQNPEKHKSKIRAGLKEYQESSLLSLYDEVEVLLQGAIKSDKHNMHAKYLDSSN